LQELLLRHELGLFVHEALDGGVEGDDAAACAFERELMLGLVEFTFVARHLVFQEGEHALRFFGAAFGVLAHVGVEDGLQHFARVGGRGVFVAGFEHAAVARGFAGFDALAQVVHDLQARILRDLEALPGARLQVRHLDGGRGLTGLRGAERDALAHAPCAMVSPSYSTVKASGAVTCSTRVCPMSRRGTWRYCSCSFSPPQA